MDPWSLVLPPVYRVKASAVSGQAEHAELSEGGRAQLAAQRLHARQHQHQSHFRGSVSAQLAGHRDDEEWCVGVPRAAGDDAGHKEREARLQGESEHCGRVLRWPGALWGVLCNSRRDKQSYHKAGVGCSVKSVGQSALLCSLFFNTLYSSFRGRKWHKRNHVVMWLHGKHSWWTQPSSQLETVGYGWTEEERTNTTLPAHPRLNRSLSLACFPFLCHSSSNLPVDEY